MSKMTKLSRSKRKILDQRTAPFLNLNWAPLKSGWIKAVRESLGMTTTQLGARMGVAASNVTILEGREVTKKTSLEMIERAAEAMGCKFVYAIIPEKSFDQIVQDQAVESAKSIIREVGHHMTLEKQKVSPEFEKDQIRTLAEEILFSMDSRLWRK